MEKEKENNAQNLLVDFEKDQLTTVLYHKYISPTFLEIIGVARKEEVHTKFLEWFLNQREFNQEFLARFLYSLSKKAIPEDFPISVYENLSISNIVASSDRKINQCRLTVNRRTQTSYPDLIISANIGENNLPLKIIIENKIDSQEHHNQTWKYYTYFKNNSEECDKKRKEFLSKNESIIKNKKFDEIKLSNKNNRYKSEKNEIIIFVYLAPEWNFCSLSDYGICDHFIKYTYQDLYDLLKTYVSSLNISPRNRFIMEEYINSLCRPYLDKNNILKILAMEKSDTKLLKKFLEKNSSLILLAVKAQKSETDDAEEIEYLNQIQQGIENYKRKRLLFNVSFPGGTASKNKNMKEIACEIMKYLLDNGKSKDFLKALLPETYWLITSKEFEEKTDSSKDKGLYKRYDRIGEDLFLRNQWTYDRFITFLEKLNEQFLGIEVTCINKEI